MVVIRVRTEKGPRAPRNLHFKVHEALRLPAKSALQGSQSVAPLISRFTQYCACYDNLRFKVHKVLRLPRNLQLEVHNVLRLPRNLHFKVRKVLLLPRNLEFERCACHELCTLKFLSALRFTNRCACYEIYTSRFTCSGPATAFRCKNASNDTIQIPKRSFRARQFTALSRNLSASKVSTVSKVLRLPRNLHFEV